MEIHRPKAAKTWGEFGIEIGTIVCGILIALTLEQVVQFIHERNLAAETRERVRVEVAENVGEAIRRLRRQDCVERRLAEIAALLDRYEGGTPLPAPIWIGNPSVWLIEDSVWRSAGNSGHANLLEPAEQAAFDDIYAQLDEFEANQHREQSAWAQLRMLESLRVLTPQAEFGLRAALQQARFAAWYARINVGQLEARLSPPAASGVVARAAAVAVADRNPGVGTVCYPLATTRAEAERMAGSTAPWGFPR